MKNILTLSIIALFAFYACGPAAEDRKKMDENARIMSDSIKANIEQSLDNVIKEVNVPSGVIFAAPGQTAGAIPASSNTPGAINTATPTAQPKK